MWEFSINGFDMQKLKRKEETATATLTTLEDKLN